MNFCDIFWKRVKSKLTVKKKKKESADLILCIILILSEFYPLLSMNFHTLHTLVALKINIRAFLGLLLLQVLCAIYSLNIHMGTK